MYQVKGKNRQKIEGIDSNKGMGDSTAFCDQISDTNLAQPVNITEQKAYVETDEYILSEILFPG